MLCNLFSYAHMLRIKLAIQSYLSLQFWNAIATAMLPARYCIAAVVCATRVN